MKISLWRKWQTDRQTDRQTHTKRNKQSRLVTWYAYKWRRGFVHYRDVTYIQYRTIHNNYQLLYNFEKVKNHRIKLQVLEIFLNTHKNKCTVFFTYSVYCTSYMSIWHETQDTPFVIPNTVYVNTLYYAFGLGWGGGLGHKSKNLSNPLQFFPSRILFFHAPKIYFWGENVDFFNAYKNDTSI